MQGRILTVSGVTFAICAAPIVASLNMVSIAVWPNWVAIAISETVRKVQSHKPISFDLRFLCVKSNSIVKYGRKIKDVS